MIRSARVVVAVFLTLTVAGLTIPDAALSGTFPGANGKIAYMSNRDSSFDRPNNEIYVIHADGTGETRLTNDIDFGNVQPSWSPDGSRIAFVRREILDEDGTTSNPQIHVMNADGSGLTNLTNDSTKRDLEPSWSPDGTRLAYARQSGGGGTPFVREIYVMNADGTQQTPLTAYGAFSSHPAWSPDGTTIAFTVDAPGPAIGDGLRDIYVMNSDGTGVINLTDNGEFNAGPSWSPDGAKIAFHHATSRLAGFAQISVMNADGTGQTPLTDDTSFDNRPSWSPDGTKIAFHSRRAVDENDNPVRMIFVMNADGSGLTQVTLTGAENQEPNWGPATKTPTELVEDLADAIDALALASGTTRSFQSKLDNARKSLAAGDTAGACSALKAFLNEVRAQTAKRKLTSEQAAELTAAAVEIMDGLGCP